MKNLNINEKALENPKQKLEKTTYTGYASIDKPWEIHYPDNYRELLTKDTSQKMYDFMVDKNKTETSRTAISYFNHHISYQELFKKIDTFARILKGYGIEQGDIVSLCLPNVPETIYIKYALNKIGAIANMIEPRHSSESILAHVNNSNSKLLFTILDACEAKINPIINKLKVDDVVIISVSDSLEYKDGIIPTYLNIKYKYQKKQIIEKAKQYNKYSFLDTFSKWGQGIQYNINAPFIENQPATIVYTSGTTGLSKGAVLSNEAYNYMHNQLMMVGDFKKGETFFGAIPFFSAYGSFCGMHNSLCATQNILLIPKFNPQTVDKEILKYKPNISFLVPEYWKTLAKSKHAQNKDLSYLKIIVAGGDRMFSSEIKLVNDFLKQHNCDHKLRVGYGASEFGGAVTVVPENEYYIPGSAGIVLPSCNIMIIDRITNQELKYGEEGEICIHTTTMMNEYLNHKEETNELIIHKNGLKYYKTGDKGYITQDGILYVIGRYKRSMMRPDGHTVHPNPIEKKISEYSGVTDCCVVGLKLEQKSGVIPTAFIQIETTEPIEQYIKKLDKFCLETISERERALAYVVVEQIPYNLMGKADYTKLEKEKIEDLNLIIVDDTFFNTCKGKAKKLIK